MTIAPRSLPTSRPLLRGPGTAVLALLAISAPRAARADAQEHTLAFGASGGILAVRHAGATAQTGNAGASVRFAVGLTNEWEIGARIQGLSGPAACWPDAHVTGDPGTLYGDVYSIDLVGELRWVPGVARTRAFARTRPVMGLSVGVEAALITRQVLLSDSNGIVSEPAAELHLVPIAGLFVGLEHRFGKAFLLAGGIDLHRSAAGALTATTASVELGWHWY